MLIRCENCQREFEKRPCRIRRSAHHFCSEGCRNAFENRQPKTTVRCAKCQREFQKFASEAERTGANYCSRSCAAQANNRLHPKRHKEHHHCVICGKEAKRGRKFCNDHRSSSILSARTLGEILRKSHGQPSNRYCSIRSNAKVVARRFSKQNGIEYACVLCGYNTFVDVCHIADISTFPHDATVGEINSLSNLTLLCKNHHKEFDNNLFESDPPSLASLQKTSDPSDPKPDTVRNVGFEPTTPSL